VLRSVSPRQGAVRHPRKRSLDSTPPDAAALRRRAIGLLARREYARAELRQKLAATGAGSTDVEQVLDELAARGYQSDARYARAVAMRERSRRGSRGIAAALRSHAVDAEAIDAAMADAGVDDQAALVALWERRYGCAPADEREKARQVRFLMARGFALSAILALLKARSR
jgi:regulatory protein